ncbi:MAG: AI-2E family transporter [Candidatus Pacebacteria bacterium]|nr:AI-2E family transporter [Candidatus Paceibacterota bacterium]
MKKEIETVDIAWRSIFKVFVVVLLFYFLFLIRSVIVWLFLGWIISTLLNPAIDEIEKRGTPRAISAAIVYFGMLLILGFIVYLIVPPLASEVAVLSSGVIESFAQIPTFLSKIGIDSFQSLSTLNGEIQNSLIRVSANILNIFASLFGSIFAGITIFVLALFMSIEEKEIIKAIKLVSPKRFEEDVLKKWDKAKMHVASWFGSRLICSFFVALMTFIVCVFLKIKFALSLSILAGLLNMVPFIGPLIAGAILILFAFSSWTKAIIVAILAIIIQQIESNILSPIFTKRMTGLSTVLVLTSILIGGILGGIVGAMLAIPLAGIIFELTREYFNKKKIEN